MNGTNTARNPGTPAFKSTHLLNMRRESLRFLHYSLHTKGAYPGRVKQCIHFMLADLPSRR